MKLKLRELVEAEKPLNRLLEVKLPVKVAYRLGKVGNKIQSELKHFYNAQTKLYKQYGECTDELNDAWTLKPENAAAFRTDRENLLDEEIELDIPKISIDDFGDVQIESGMVSALTFLFE